jgi:type II secretory pathway pseudopilin PulG
MTAKNKYRVNQGFTLFETAIALIIFFIIIGIMISFFTDQRLNIINNEIKTGAVTFSQEILDELRQKDITTLPSSGSAIRTKTLIGKDYSATITYCGTGTTAYCSASARHIKVQVNYGNQEVYSVETIYTRLQ